ncbi:aldose epimerase family protein [Catalinimonas niigatensis]|uniref:aldose epimerase family protein n=1 Tax=Catalinimonas niigatensis TaxID=1397264 RepID=UPI0026658389|nr:aldose epimerase family protein [Catalinimonas niigatensis]WPP49221.1 aldose epimerase family protein [Catalinimonas niigatensis]
MKERITTQRWGKHQEKEVYLFRIENTDGTFVELTNYGASMVSIHVPDRKGELGNVVLGFPSLEGYVQDRSYVGATIGRFANRIKGAEFTLDGKRYVLEDNDHGNSNHGGTSGFHAKVFDFEVGEDQLTFHLHSPNGEGGYPGNLRLSVSYSWNEHHEMYIHYTAHTDQKTITNFTNHAYFNLSSEAQSILDHELNIEAQEMLEMGADFIPTGKIIPVAHIDFSQDKIRSKMTFRNDTVKGLNSCYVLDRKTEKPDAILMDASSGRKMEVFTSYPGMLLYTGDYLFSQVPGHHSKNYKAFDGLCLECQYYPDSPHHPHFPSSILEVGQLYDEFIKLRFNTF